MEPLLRQVFAKTPVSAFVVGPAGQACRKATVLKNGNMTPRCSILPEGGGLAGRLQVLAMEMVLAVAALAGVIWALVLLARGGLLAGGVAVVLAGCCFGHPFFHVSLGPIPLTLDRLLWVALIGMWFVWRRRGWLAGRPFGRAEWVLAALLLTLLASTLLHDWRYDGNKPLAHLVFFYVMPAGLYLVARDATLSPRALVGLWTALALFGLYLAVTAVAEVSGQWWAVFPRYIASPEHSEFFGRARGPLLNPVACGLFQGTGLLATLLLWPRLGRRGRAALVGVVGALGLGLYATLTRSVWMGAALGVMIALGLATPRRWRVPLVAGALVLGTLVAATQWERLLAFKRDEHLSAQEAADSVRLRPILARVAWNMFRDRPLLGCGYGQYLTEQVDYLSDRSTDLALGQARPYVQHNVFLALLVETGLVGMGLFVALLTLWVRDAWRLWRSGDAPETARAQGLLFLAMMGVYLANAMFHDLALMPQVNMLLFLAAGVTAALRRPTAAGAPAGAAAALPVRPLAGGAR